MNTGRAYVYEHWRPDLNVPFWVGKGTGSRYRVHKRRRNSHYNGIVAKLKSLGLKVEVRFVAVDLSEEEAFRIEIERMAYWKDCGVRLANKSPGGRGGMTGVERSLESRAKQSATAKGRRLSPEHVEAIRQAQRRPEIRAVASARETGKKLSPEHRTKIGAAHKASGHRPRIPTRGTKVSEETRAKLRAAKTPEVRARISAAAKKQWENPEFRKLVSETMKRTNTARKVAAYA